MVTDQKLGDLFSNYGFVHGVWRVVTCRLAYRFDAAVDGNWMVAEDFGMREI